MTNETEGSRPAPGSGAGDAAPTQAIPRIAKPGNEPSSAPAKQPVSKPAPNAVPKAVNKPAPTAAETDKGRPRPASAAKGASAPGATSQVRPEASRKPAPEAGTKDTGRPLTAADYARTTRQSPATTSVIPAYKEPAKDAKRERPAPATVAPAPGGTGRRASLRLTHVEPWSVTRLAFAISVAMMIVAFVAVGVFWAVLHVVGVWDQINESFTTVLSDDSASFNINDYFGLGRVLGLTLVLSAVNVVLMTALATIGAHLYNLAAQLMGGVEVTFAEEK